MCLRTLRSGVYGYLAGDDQAISLYRDAVVRSEAANLPHSTDLCASVTGLLAARSG